MPESTEARLLISLLRGDEAPDASGHADYGVLLKMASMNLVLPLLYRRSEKNKGVPDDVIAVLSGAYHSTLQKNILHLKETMKLVKSLRGAGIEAIPLKGSFAAEAVFKDLGVYPTSDIDLLVRPEDMKKAEARFRKEGYEKVEGISQKDLMSSHYHLAFQNSDYVVELHWNLAKRYFDIPPDFWWKERREVEFEGERISQLSAEKYLMYSIFHLFMHGFLPLKFLVLVSGIIGRYKDEMDWAKLLDYAGKYKMSRLTIFTLKLAHELLGAEIPAFISGRNLAGYDFVRRAVLSGLFREASMAHLKMSNYILLLDGPVEMAKIILGRIFPGQGEIRLRFGLAEKSKMVYLYYFLNPFLLVFRRK